MGDVYEQCLITIKGDKSRGHISEGSKEGKKPLCLAR